VQLTITPDDLRPLVEAIVAQTVASLAADSAAIGDRLAIPEAEAARLISLEPHVLRDERLRGRIGASQVVGRRILYSRQDLLDYLAGRRFEPK